jgi:hypothetical protein
MWKWILSHLRLVSLSSLPGVSAAVVGIWKWRRQKRLSKCSRVLRSHVDEIRMLADPDTIEGEGFSKAQLKRAVKLKGKIRSFDIDDVLEFMEKNGTAVKVTSGRWQIR